MDDQRIAKQVADRLSAVQGANPQSGSRFGDRETVIRDRKTKQKEEVVPGNFKYLYRTQEVVSGTTFYSYWVGGHSPDPIKMFTTSTNISTSRLSNLGGANFILDLKMSDLIQSRRNQSIAWELQLPPERLNVTALQGYGFFTGERVVNEIDTNTNTGPNSWEHFYQETVETFFVYAGALTAVSNISYISTLIHSGDGSSSTETRTHMRNQEWFRLPSRRFELSSGPGNATLSEPSGSLSRSCTLVLRTPFAMSPDGKNALFSRGDRYGSDSRPPYVDTSRFEDRFELYKNGASILGPVFASATNGDSTGQAEFPTTWTIELVEGYKVLYVEVPRYIDDGLLFLENSQPFKLFYYQDTWTQPPGSYVWKAKRVYLSNSGTIYTYYIPGKNLSKTEKTIFEVSKLRGLNDVAKTYKRTCYPPHTATAQILGAVSYYE